MKKPAVIARAPSERKDDDEPMTLEEFGAWHTKRIERALDELQQQIDAHFEREDVQVH